MGCGASKVTPQTGEEHGSKIAQSNGHVNGSAVKSNGETAELNTNANSAVLNGNDVVNSNREVLDKHAIEETRDSTTNAGENQTAQSPVSKPVAFDIALGQTDQLSTLTQHRPPRRLKKIESAPTLTRANLEQKQAAADQNRQKELDKKVKVVSKRRSELLMAREMDKAQQQKTEIEEKLSASERKRENAKNEVIAKQRQREEKAKRVRSKAKQMKDGDDVVDFDVDRDDTYNADEEDESWDADTPKSHSISSNLNDGNNSHKPGDREQATPPLQNSEPTTDNQQNRNEVHDFFDS